MPVASRRLGQFVVVGFDGVTVPVELRSLAREFDLGGAILFARNVESPEQVAELARDLGALAGDLPLWIAIDQEGGRVARLRRPFTEWPPMITLGRSGDEQLAARFARALARELAAVGVSLDCAPVLDVHTNPANPVIGDRAIAEDAATVARLGAAIVVALQDEGIAACGKHFPGHGDTGVDSHETLPVVDHPPDRLRAVELVPFRRAIEAQVAAIMMAHLLVPALDDRRPASLSRAIVHGLLRTEMGFDGLIVSDDMGMKAITAGRTLEQATVGAVAAGCDLVLLCGADHGRHAAALEALVHAVEGDEIPSREIDDGLSRQRRVKARFAARAGSPLAPGWRPPARAALRAIIESERHRAIAGDMARFL